MKASKRLRATAPSPVVATVLWSLLLTAVSNSPQSAQGADFLAYPLQHARAAEIQSAVEAVLPAGSEILADSSGNRLLVAGSAETHQIAQNAIRSLDRPRSEAAAPQSAPPAPAAKKPVMAAYPVAAGKAEATAQWLREQLADTTDVRIVADPRTSQVLVLAPTDVQAQIAAEIGRPAVSGSPAGAPGRSAARPAGDSPITAPRKPAQAPTWTPNTSLPPATAGDGRRAQVVQLWHTTAPALESSLVDMLGQRMARAGAAGEGRYTLAVSGGRELAIALDAQGNRVAIEGAASAVEACVRLVHALDAPQDAAGMNTQVVPLDVASSAHLRRAVAAIQAGASGPAAARASQAQAGAGRNTPVSMQIEKPDGEEPAEKPAPDETQPGMEQPPAFQPKPEAPAAETPPGEAPGADERPGVIGQVQVELLQGLDVLVVRGLKRDVEQVLAVIEQIERLARVTEPVIEVYTVKHVDCEAVAALVQQLYVEIFEPRQGLVSVTPLVKPNALLVIGQRNNVDRVLDLVKKLDRPVAPETQFRVFRLKHAAAETVQAQVQEFYAQRAGLGVRVLVTSDYRSNSLVVMARPRDMIEVAALIERLDTDKSDTIHEIRVFKLEHSLAEDLAPILQSAIAGEGAARAPGAPPGAQPAAQPAPAAARRTGGAESKATMLSFATVDTQGQRVLKSGILTDARITADARTNALVVAAPAQNMPLLEALIRQLDQMPAAEAQIKVFTIVNGDAPGLVEMLEALFASRQAGAGGGAGQLQPQNVAVQGESSLVPLRFAVDARTNSIIASGTPGFLTVVEAILLRLDDSDVRNRKSLVYRLRNAPALDVANAINQFLQTERQVQQTAPGMLSAFEQIQREVVVVPEIVSNSLILSATPRFYDEIVKLIEDIDKRPPMVMIQVLIAEVQLSDLDEFGVELGLQDSILFDRSILSNIVTTTSTTTFPNGSQTTNQNVTAADIQPGFIFNNQPLGNSGATNAMQNANVVGSQALSHFGVGRVNSELGFGGLVLSASSESVSILIRALKECRRLDILSRPQVMTLDNQPAFIQVGQEVPTIRGTQLNETGQVNNIDYANVGLILGVTPRISPDGLVVMEIDAVKSEVGPEAEGIPISISATGDVIRSPRINTTRAQTTVSSLNGQTIVLGGLITKSQSKVHRRVPLLSEIPVLGNLFRYDNVASRRTELLIIMTPHIVNNEQDSDILRQTEAGRMSWCLGDVIKLHGDAGLRSRGDEWADGETAVVYPDVNPTADSLPSCRPLARLRTLGEPLPPYPRNRLEPRRDLAPLASECDPPAVCPHPGRAACLPHGAPADGMPVEGAPTEGGPWPPAEGHPESVPTPAPDVGQPPVSAESFLPAPEKPALRPFEKLRAKLTGKPAPSGPTGLAAGYQQVQDTDAPGRGEPAGPWRDQDVRLPPGARVIDDRPVLQSPGVPRQEWDAGGAPPDFEAAPPRAFEPAEPNPLRGPAPRQPSYPVAPAAADR